MTTYIARDREINLLFSESQAMYHKLIESVKNGVYMADVQGTLFFINQAFVDILGYSSKDELLGRNVRDLYEHPQDRDGFLHELERKGFVSEYEVKNVRKDGSVVVLSATSNYIRNSQGLVIGVEGIVHDITEHKKLEENLKLEKMKLEEILLFDEQVSSIRKLNKLVDFIVEKITTILKAEKCSLMLVDDVSNDLCIKSAKGLEDDVIRLTRLKLGEGICGRVAQDGETVLVKNIEYDTRFQRGNRPSYSSRSFMCASIKINNRLIGIINVADKNKGQDVFGDVDLKILSTIVRRIAHAIETAKLYQELEYLSVTDPLTNLSNYRYFVHSVDEEISRFKRFGNPFSLLMIDVDEFKHYNDTYGHLEGDIFLQELGKIFMVNLRAIDKVCRYGGDEFVILLPGTVLDQAREVASKLRERVEYQQFKEKMTVSIGVAEFRKSMTRFEFILRADRALYEAKGKGKNRYCC